MFEPFSKAQSELESILQGSNLAAKLFSIDWILMSAFIYFLEPFQKVTKGRFHSMRCV